MYHLFISFNGNAFQRRRQWQPTPVLLPGKPHGWRSLVGCSPWGSKESDTTSFSRSLFTFMHWRRKWQPTPVYLPRESQGWGSLVGCHLWGRTESDTTEVTQQQQQQCLSKSQCNITSRILTLIQEAIGVPSLQGILVCLFVAMISFPISYSFLNPLQPL